MPTRILSFAQLCNEQDPNLHTGALRPWVYQFSNNRRFYERNPVYLPPGITDDSGSFIVDDFGNRIQSDNQSGASKTPGFPFGSGAFGTDSF